MYDIDDSPFNQLLDIQSRCLATYHKGSIICDLMETVVEYWSEQDDTPPVILSLGQGLKGDVAEAVHDMVHHICDKDRNSQS